jgi:F0F1-type ATP synthase membrane subunit c/vacuolar-type H+-ATPase subunit K
MAVDGIGVAVGGTGVATGVGMTAGAQALKTTASNRMKVVIFMLIVHRNENARKNLL